MGKGFDPLDLQDYLMKAEEYQTFSSDRKSTLICRIYQKK